MELLGPLQCHLWQRQPEENPVLWLCLYCHRVKNLWPAPLSWYTFPSSSYPLLCRLPLLSAVKFLKIAQIKACSQVGLDPMEDFHGWKGRKVSDYSPALLLQISSSPPCCFCASHGVSFPAGAALGLGEAGKPCSVDRNPFSVDRIPSLHWTQAIWPLLFTWFWDGQLS